SGNSAAHTVKIVNSDGTDLAGASVSVATSGATPGQFAYASLSVPARLAPNRSYFVVSHEVNGGDIWCDLGCIPTTTPPGSISGPVYANEGSSSYYDYSAGYPSQSYVPVSLKYAAGWQLAGEVRYMYDGNLVVQERWFDPQLSTTIPQQTISLTRG